MSSDEVAELFAVALKGRQLLDHPFYRRWEAGELQPRELADYANQYRYFEQELPVIIDRVARQLPAGRARDLMLANLADELGPPTHVGLFEEFADAVGSTGDPKGRAVRDLLAVYHDAAEHDPVEALAVIAAYEIQASEVAMTKSRALQDHYGVDASGRAFWDVHTSTEVDHARWTLEALAECSKRELISDAAGRSAIAWWHFLDERELAASGA